MSFATSKFVPNDARTTVITVTSYEDKNPAGMIFNTYFGEAFAFRSLTELFISVDAMLDELELPRASTNTRRFTSPAANAAPPLVKKMQETLATFKLKVLFRQNASWQGNLTWVEGKSEAPFRSVLELVHLINSALSGNEGGS